MKPNVGPLYVAYLLAAPSGPNTVKFVIFIFYLMTERYPDFEALCVCNRDRTLEIVIYM
jgi:hypothetical protein